MRLAKGAFANLPVAPFYTSDAAYFAMRSLNQGELTEADRLVLQTIVACPDGTLYGAKKLQKLLFMAHRPRAFGLEPPRPLRIFRFKVYKHGPFSEEVYASLERLERRGLIEIETRDLSRAPAAPVSPEDADEDAPPLQVRVYRATQGARSEVVGADESDRRLLRAAVSRWGWLTSEQIEDLVLIRTGLTPSLKARFAGVDWSTFEKQAVEELPKERPEPTEQFWRSQQQFFKERAALMMEVGPGKFAAYLAAKRVGIGDDQIDLYKEILRTHGQPPDYIGYVSETGRLRVDALPSG